MSVPAIQAVNSRRRLSGSPKTPSTESAMSYLHFSDITCAAELVKYRIAAGTHPAGSPSGNNALQCVPPDRGQTRSSLILMLVLCYPGI